MSRKNRGKIEKPSQTVVIEQKKADWWSPVLLVMAGLLIFYPPLLGGLFNDSRMFISHIITSIVFALVLADRIYHQDYVLLRTPMDWAILAYAGAYLLSLIGAVHQGEAIYGFLKALNYFMVYWVVTRIASSHQQIRDMLKYLLAGGLAVAVIGIMAAAGYSDYPGAFVSGQIMSTLQYSNTMAAYLAVMILLGVTLVQQENNFFLKAIYSIANFLMALAVLGALSKGAWVILIGGALLLLIGMPGIYRIKSMYFLGLAMGAALLVYQPFIVAISSTPPSNVLTYAGLGSLLAIGGVLVWEVLERVWKRQRSAPLIITVVFLVLLASGVLFTGSQVLQSSNLITEISTLGDSENNSYVTRLEFMRCAMEIVKDHPIVGTGAGGWEALFQQYQKFSFWTTETHSHFFQVWVEIGTIGLLAFISIWGILFYYIYSIYKNRKDEDLSQWILGWGIAAGCLALGAHSAIDFDLSIPAMCMVLWSLLGLLNSLYNEKTNILSLTAGRPGYAWIQYGLAGLLAVILLVSGSKYLYASNQASQGKNAFISGMKQSSVSAQKAGFNEAIQCYTNAVQSNPTNGVYRGDLATIQGSFYRLLVEQQDPQANIYRQESIEMMQKAADLRPHDPKLLSALFRNAAYIGDLPGLLKYGQMEIKTSPNDPWLYTSVGKLWWDASQKCWENDQEDMALEFAGQILALHQDLRQQMTKVNLDHPLWEGERLRVTPEFNKVYQEAGRLLEQQDKSE